MGLLLYAAASVPFIAMAIRPAISKWVAPVCAIAITGLTIYQTGLMNRHAFASTRVGDLLRAQPGSERCRQITDVLAQNGLAHRTPGGDAVTIDPRILAQMPSEVRDAIQDCVQPPAKTAA